MDPISPARALLSRCQTINLRIKTWIRRIFSCLPYQVCFWPQSCVFVYFCSATFISLSLYKKNTYISMYLQSTASKFSVVHVLLQASGCVNTGSCSNPQEELNFSWFHVRSKYLNIDRSLSSFHLEKQKKNELCHLLFPPKTKEINARKLKRHREPRIISSCS